MGGGAHHRPLKTNYTSILTHRRFTMNTLNTRITFAAVAAAVLLTTAGCAVTRGQETVGAYVDDTAITTAVKGRYVGNKEVDASSIRVETLNGTVMLSGFAKNSTEKSTAEAIAWRVNGVKSVKNQIDVRP
jgi:hyperosmotically inducible periplasmic protein